MRTRRRSHHIAAETIEEPLDDLPQANKPQNKRQRRLTAHQRGTNAPLGGLKQQLQAPKAAPVAVAPALKQPDANNRAGKSVPIVERQQIPDEPSSMSESESDLQPSYTEPKYISSGSSRRMVPGKRIKWRSAILESDNIRQDLSLAFLFAALNSNGEEEAPAAPAPADEPKQEPLKAPASALRSRRR